MRRVRIVLFLAGLSLFGMSARGQMVSAPSLNSGRFFAGGGGGFYFGTNSAGFRYNYYSLFPIVGYKATPDFWVGTGFNYQHNSYPDQGLTLNQYGVTPFARYNFNQLFFQTELDVISSPSFDYYTTGNRQIYNRLLFGIGYRQPLGNRRTAINAMAMYDVLYRQPSVFNSPIVLRVFFTF